MKAKRYKAEEATIYVEPAPSAPIVGIRRKTFSKREPGRFSVSIRVDKSDQLRL